MSDTEKSPLEFKPLGKRGINLTGESPQQADPLPEADDLAELLEEDDGRLSPEMLADSAEEADISLVTAEEIQPDLTESDPAPVAEQQIDNTRPDIAAEMAAGNTRSDEEADYAIDSLGGTLRHAREKQGYAIPDIADHLRIRKSHLIALENETWDDLPGTVYIIGYLRSYGSFLDLDPHELISRYKSGDHGPVAANDLSFPSPQKESRMPKWPLIAATLVAGAVGYVFWADWNAEKGPVETVMPAPGMDETTPTAAPATASRQEASDNSDTTASAAPTGTAETVTGTSTETSVAIEETTPAATADADKITASTIADTVPQDSGPVIATNDVPVTSTETPAEDSLPETTDTAGTADTAVDETTAAETLPAEIQATEIQAIETTDTPANEPVASVIPTPSIGVSEANAAPSESGPVGGDSRITLIGRHDAWIQIKDGEGEVLAARLLRKDESYHVPNLAGLKLVTGNAGGLEVAVDGRPGKSLGPIGGVLRDLVLDPDNLKAE